MSHWDSKDEKKCVHTEHCCKVHGCKYGDALCPVTLKSKKQSFPCEDCCLPQEPEQFVPKAGEWCEHINDGSRKMYGELLMVGFRSDGTYVMEAKIHGDLLEFVGNPFRPIKTERERVQEWVESKVDCLGDYALDQAILITKLLDLGCLVIPDDKK